MARSDTGAPLSLYAFPDDNVAPSAAVTCATENPLYTAAMLVDLKPGKPFKSTLATATIVFTFGSPTAIKAIAIINHNLAGRTLTLTNNNGLSSVSIPIDANDHDAICLNAWKRFDDQSASVRTATVWTLTVPTGSANAAIGEVLLLVDIQEFDLLWGLRQKPRRPMARPGTTFGGTLLKYRKRIRVREIRGQVNLAEDDTALRRLESGANGDYHPFFFVWDEDVNDCMMVQFEPDTFEFGPTDVGISEKPIRFLEVSSGPPLFP